MIHRNTLLKFSLLLVLLVNLLSGCAQSTATVAPTVAPTHTAEAVAPTEEPTVVPTATAVPTTVPDRLVLATTTSTQDSGLLDYLLPDFKAKTGLDLQVVAVGSGQAMEAGKNGDADVLLVHSPKAEEQFVADGYGVDRTAVMHNDYVLIGPTADPAGVKGMTDTVAAFAKIAAAGATFISRGDNSGTHSKELSIWSKATISPTRESWYVSAGQGMGAVLQMAEEKEAYTLSDRGTYMARTAEGYSLPILLEGDKVLFNPYHVIAVNPEKYPDINYTGAKAFIDWIVSPETQALISAFTEPKSGKPLFYPDAVTP